MKLVSFDIGLRNLACCVLQGTNRNDVKIVHWEVIDVMAEGAGHDKPLCFKCKKPANYSSQESYACIRHKGNGKAVTKSSLTKKTLDELKKEAGKDGTKKELVDLLYKQYSQNVWKRCVKSAKQISVVDLAPFLQKSLESRKDIWKDADLIACEQQPDKRMLCVQAMMHMWFVCKNYKCQGISAVHKLTNIITVDDSTKTYRGRKKTGIVHAAQLVPQIWKEYMMKHPKKDDLADSFLQGLWVLENGK